MVNYLKKKGCIFTKIDKMEENIPFLIILQAMGLTKVKILQTLKNQIVALNLKKNESVASTEEALNHLSRIFIEPELNIV